MRLDMDVRWIGIRMRWKHPINRMHLLFFPLLPPKICMETLDPMHIELGLTPLPVGLFPLLRTSLQLLLNHQNSHGKDPSRYIL